MEPIAFDELTKALATSTSRRQALKTITATTLGSILGLAGIGSAFAARKCRGVGDKCTHGGQCCFNYCANNVCACPPGTTNCGGICANLLADSNNCGSCGNVCADRCILGTCS